MLGVIAPVVASIVNPAGVTENVPPDVPVMVGVCAALTLVQNEEDG